MEGELLEVPAVTGTLDLYMVEINRFPILTAEEEFRLAVQLAKSNDMEAAERLVVSNLRFVVKIAHEYRNYGLKLADLVHKLLGWSIGYIPERLIPLGIGGLLRRFPVPLLSPVIEAYKTMKPKQPLQVFRLGTPGL